MAPIATIQVPVQLARAGKYQDYKIRLVFRWALPPPLGASKVAGKQRVAP
jgi:hypothetical protein